MSAPPASAWRSSVLAVARRPELWGPGLRQVGRLAPRGWWRQRPFLPVPTEEYLHFRELTAYGGTGVSGDGGDGGDGGLIAEDVCAFLAWCGEFPRARA